MKGIKCTTSNCEFNEGCHCRAGIVNVDKNGNCDTKLKRENGVIEQEFINMETAAEFSFDSSDDTFIECKSNGCAHNKNNKCLAEHINVGDKMMHTKCKSREK